MFRWTRLLGRLAPPLAAVMLTWNPAIAGPPTDRLRGFFASVNDVLTDPTTEHQPLERVARVRRLVTDLTDIPSAAALALGSEWETRTPAERQEFIEVFAELLERAYVGRLAGAVRVTGTVTLRYLDETVAGDTAAVTTTITGASGEIVYRMTLRGGRWLVRDIVLDGVSVVDNYRAQLKRLLRNDSFPAVMSAMRTKLAGESLLFAALPRRPTPIASAPEPETQTVVAAPPPEETARPTPPPPYRRTPAPRAPEPPRVATRPAKPAKVVTADAPAATRRPTAVVAAATPATVPSSASTGPSSSAPVAAAIVAPSTPKPPATVTAPAAVATAGSGVSTESDRSARSIALVVITLMLGLGVGGLVYRHLR